MRLRPVQVYKWEQQVIDGCRQNVKVADFKGEFHQFGQGDDGDGMPMPIAIVEAPDGHVRSVYCEMVQFLDVAPAPGVAA